MNTDTTRRFPPVKVAALALACAMASPAWVHATEDEQKSETQAATMQSESSTSSSADGALGALAEEEDDLSTFVKAVEQAGLGQALEGGTYTIFAPTNEAFESGDQSVDELMKPENRDQLVSLLRAHIVADDVDPEMAGKIGQARTVDGGTVELSGEGESMKVGDAAVVKSDIQQGELRIYAIDQLLTPNPSESVASTPSFEELDEDGDGYLSESELEGQESLASQKSEMDSDGDDQVSRTEFSAFEQQQDGNSATESAQQEESDSGWFGGDDDEESQGSSQ